MQISIQNGSQLDVSDSIFACEYNEGLVHQLLTSYMAKSRQGSKAQKSRADVTGGGVKPWRQKGTGRARAGTSTSPIWRSGGVTFAAQPRDFSKKLNKKMYRKGIKIILSELLRQDRFIVSNELELPAPKTKDLVAKLNHLGLKNVLIVLPEFDRTVELAARNIPGVYVCTSSEINPLSLVAADKVLVTVSALKKIEEGLE